MEEEKKYTIEEMFQCLPELLETFKSCERWIKRYNCYRWDEGVGKEKLEYKREMLLEVVKKLDIREMKIIYYIRNLGHPLKGYILRSLGTLFRAQCELKNALENTDRYYDPMDIAAHGGKNRKKP